MQVGDLVKWAFPSGGFDIGIISGFENGEIEITWSDGIGNGFYNPSHPQLELISESR